MMDHGTASALLSVLATLSLALASPGHAAQWTVPTDPGCGTIQACIDQAVDGDTIHVVTGVYAENIDFLGKTVTVASLDGPGSATIMGVRADLPVVTFDSGEGAGSVLKDFIVTGGGGETVPGLWGDINMGIGILCRNASPTIQGNRISGNSPAPSPAGSAGGTGISIEDGSPIIVENLIEENNGNAAVEGLGAGISISNMTPGLPPVVIQGNTIRKNIGSHTVYMGASLGAGIAVTAAGEILVENNILAWNAGGSLSYGLGAALTSVEQATIRHNTIVENSPGGGGGIVLSVGVSADVMNNIITQHTTGDGLALSGTGTINADYNNVWDNQTNYADPVLQGAHDISADPLFEDAHAQDLHLQGASPCIDRGTDLGVARDIDGDARPQGFRVDMGADEVPIESWGPAAVVSPHVLQASGPMNWTLFLLVPAAVLWARRRAAREEDEPITSRTGPAVRNGHIREVERGPLGNVSAARAWMDFVLGKGTGQRKGECGCVENARRTSGVEK